MCLSCIVWISWDHQVFVRNCFVWFCFVLFQFLSVFGWYSCCCWYVYAHSTCYSAFYPLIDANILKKNFQLHTFYSNEFCVWAAHSGENLMCIHILICKLLYLCLLYTMETQRTQNRLKVVLFHYFSARLSFWLQYAMPESVCVRKIEHNSLLEYDLTKTKEIRQKEEIWRRRRRKNQIRKIHDFMFVTVTYRSIHSISFFICCLHKNCTKFYSMLSVAIHLMSICSYFVIWINSSMLNSKLKWCNRGTNNKSTVEKRAIIVFRNWFHPISLVVRRTKRWKI